MNSIRPNANPNATEPDVVLVGAGIMSATLGVLLKEVEPALAIAMFETLHECAQESSNGWNNAGTGHASNCELYYTPQRNNGSVDISKALEVNTQFDLSRQLWSFLVDKGAIPDPRAFIRPCPHMSFVGVPVMSRSCASASKRCRRTTAFTAWSTARTAAKLPSGRRSSWTGGTTQSCSRQPASSPAARSTMAR